MAKLKAPFLSLEASGSLGGEITAQRTRGKDIVRTKPIPTDPVSLAQIYQRWDYQDYIAQWNNLSEAAKQIYKSQAARKHMTGLSLFMQGKLRDLPDLAGRWRLDEESGTRANDTSRNANTGVIYGASPALGVIDNGYYFDGLNDYIAFPSSPSLDITGDITIEAFVKRGSIGGVQAIVSKREGNDQQYTFWFMGDNRLWLGWYEGGWKNINSLSAITDTTTWHHIVVTRTPTATDFYIDGFLDRHKPWVSTFTSWDVGLAIGSHSPVWPGSYFKGHLDHVAIYNRVLTPAEIKRHSERRYP